MLVVQITNPLAPVKEDYRAAASYLTENTSSQDIIVASAPFTIYPIEYYYAGNARIVTQPLWDRFSQGAIPAFNKERLATETKEATRSYQRAFVILSFDQGYNKEVKDYYDSHYERIDSKQFSQGLDVYTYKIRYDKPLTVTPITGEDE
jgi:hypothetical protein